jgi:hypothetical protein
MAISWLAVFADVPEPLVPVALEFWAAITASSPREAAGDRDEYLPLAADGEDPYLWVQRVQRPESDGGWHPDLYVDDLPKAVSLATDLGAEVVRQVPGLVGLSTSAGQPFCLVVSDGAQRRGRPRRWPDGQHSLLDQICLDSEDDAGPARAHADLASDDVPAETRRHRELGAAVVRIAEHWTTLRDPAGLTYCITDRDPFRD